MYAHIIVVAVISVSSPQPHHHHHAIMDPLVGILLINYNVIWGVGGVQKPSVCVCVKGEIPVGVGRGGGGVTGRSP